MPRSMGSPTWASVPWALFRCHSCGCCFLGTCLSERFHEEGGSVWLQTSPSASSRTFPFKTLLVTASQNSNFHGQCGDHVLLEILDGRNFRHTAHTVLTCACQDGEDGPCSPGEIRGTGKTSVPPPRPCREHSPPAGLAAQALES